MVSVEGVYSIRKDSDLEEDDVCSDSFKTFWEHVDEERHFVEFNKEAKQEDVQDPQSKSGENENEEKIEKDETENEKKENYRVSLDTSTLQNIDKYDDNLEEEDDELTYPVAMVGCSNCISDKTERLYNNNLICKNICGHVLCRRCVTIAVIRLIKNEISELNCPCFKCDSLIEQDTVEKLIGKAVYDAYLSASLYQRKNDVEDNMYYCKTLGCKGFCFVEDDTSPHFLCPICGMYYYINYKNNKEPIKLQALNENMQIQLYNELEITEMFICPICYDAYTPDEGLVFDNCSHTFCKVCIADKLSSADVNYIICPYNDGNYSCDVTTWRSEIKAVPKTNESTTLDIEGVYSISNDSDLEEDDVCTDSFKTFWEHVEEERHLAVVDKKVKHEKEDPRCKSDKNDDEKKIKEDETEHGQKEECKVLPYTAIRQYPDGYDCPVCGRVVAYDGEDVVQLNICGHKFCRLCVIDAVKRLIRFEIREIRCPHFKCDSLIEEVNIRKLVGKVYYEDYLTALLNQVKYDERNNIYCCNTPGCNGFCFVEDDNAHYFLCPICEGDNYINYKVIETTTEPQVIVDEKTEHYNTLVSLQEESIVPNFESFECLVCLSAKKPYEGVVLRNCLHTFCKECICKFIMYATDANVKCPYNDGNNACDEFLMQFEIKALLNPEEFEKYLQMSISQAEKEAGQSAYHCKVPNCSGWYYCEPDVEMFLCIVCKRYNCLLCQQVHSIKKNCLEDIAAGLTTTIDPLIDTMLRKKEAMMCPGCNIFITKIDGCDAITCGACKTEICWPTRGRRWGPKGKGDMSGGCQCNVNGRKCHVTCRNCH